MGAKLEFPVTPRIRLELEKAGIRHIWDKIEVHEESYDELRALIEHGGYGHLTPDERHAIAVGCCYTHPDHKDKHLEPLRHPIKKASRRYAEYLAASIEWKVYSMILFRAIVIALLVLLVTNSAKCQDVPSQITVIKFTDSGNTQIKGFVAPFTIKCGASMTCTASGSILTMQSNATGTVTSFSSGNLPPLFTTSVSNATTTPALSFALSNAGANTVFGNNTGSSTAPAFFSFIAPVTKAAIASNWLRSFDASTGLFTASQPAFTDISGTATNAQLPAPVTQSLEPLNSTGLPATPTFNMWLVGGTCCPVIGKMYIGDGGGEEVDFVSRNTSVDTTRFRFTDTGVMYLTNHLYPLSIDAYTFYVNNSKYTGDFCAKVNQIITTEPGCSTGGGCVINSQSIQDSSETCASPISLDRPIKLSMGPMVLTCTGKCLTITSNAAIGSIIEGMGGTVLQTSSATSDIMDTGGTGLLDVDVHNITFRASVTRSAGCAINATGSGGHFYNLVFERTWNGWCTITAGAGNNFLRDSFFRVGGSTAGNWNSAIVIGGNSSGIVANTMVDHIAVVGDAAFATSMIDVNGGTDTPIISNAVAVQSGVDSIGLLIRNTTANFDPRRGRFEAIVIEGGPTKDGVSITAGNDLKFVNPYCATSLICLHVNGATVQQVTWNTGVFINVQQNAVKIDAGKQVRILNSWATDTGVATNNTFPVFSVAANINDFAIMNNETTCFACGANKPSTGVTVAAGTSDRYEISHNTFQSLAGAAISDGGTGLNKFIIANKPAQSNIFSSTIGMLGATSGSITLVVPAVAGANTATFPAATGTVLEHNTTNTMGASGTFDGSAMAATAGFKVPVAAGAAPTANGAAAYDSTANQYSVGVNGTNRKIPIIIATGSTALPTSSVTTLTCNAGTAATATGAASTDVIDWSINAAPTATNKYGAFIQVFAVPSANTVTFYQCNPSGTTSTPTAMTVNWAVRR